MRDTAVPRCDGDFSEGDVARVFRYKSSERSADSGTRKRKKERKGRGGTYLQAESLGTAAEQSVTTFETLKPRRNAPDPSLVHR